MPSADIISLTLMFAGIPLLIPALLSLFRRQYDRRRFLAALSAVLHLIASIYSISLNITAGVPDSEQTGLLMFLLSFLIGIFAGLSLLGAVFCEPDGKIRLLHRQTPIPVSLLACAMLPVLTANAGQHFFPAVNLVRYGFSLSVFLTDLNFRREAGAKVDDQAADLELRQAKLLTEQIQPHFIFNVLMSIQNLCYQDADAAADCIAQFAGYLRGNMSALTAENLIPFETELEHIREYEALEHACTDQPFSLEYEIGAADFEIPALTVQPVVENAIKHGALTLRDGTGKAVLKTERIGQCIRITVTNNGCIASGMTAQQKSHRSIGLENVGRRLAVQCGGTLHTVLGENEAKVTILIPEKGDDLHADDHC